MSLLQTYCLSLLLILGNPLVEPTGAHLPLQIINHALIHHIISLLISKLKQSLAEKASVSWTAHAVAIKSRFELSKRMLSFPRVHPSLHSALAGEPTRVCIKAPY